MRSSTWVSAMAVSAAFGSRNGPEGGSDHFEQRRHGIARQFGHIGRACWDRGGDVHRAVSRVASKPKALELS
jgi:hypothetical protein